MFRWIGQLVARRWIIFLLAWAALFAGLCLETPEWDRFAKEGEFAFLPAESPSRRGEEFFDKAFPNLPAKSTAVLVIHRPEGAREIREEDWEFIRRQLLPALGELRNALAGEAAAAGEDSAQPAGTSPIVRVRSFADQPAGPLLISANRQATLVVADLATEFLSGQNRRIVPRIGDVIHRLQQAGKVPGGLAIDLTGSAAIGSDVQQARLDSARAVEFWTVWIVIGLLLIVLRAPLVAFVPLVTLYLSVKIALSALTIMAEKGIVGVFQGLEVYTTVLVYGAGVDYSLFLISRFREELDRFGSAGPALAESTRRVGAAIAASAGTGILGIAMLTLAQFGKFQQAGISISLGLLVMLCASLSFTPALLRLMGHWAFWPAFRPQRQTREPGRLERFWHWTGTKLERRPLIIGGITVLLMTPFGGLGLAHYDDVSYGLVNDLPRHSASVQGLDTLEKYFSAGLAGPVTVLVHDQTVDFKSPPGLAAVEKLLGNLRESHKHLQVADVRSVIEPLGTTDQAQAALPEAGSPFVRQLIRQRAAETYTSQRGEATRLEVVLAADPLQRQSIERLDRLEQALRDGLPPALAQAEIHLTGPTASLRDLRNVAQQDRIRIMAGVTGMVLLILIILLRRLAISLFLMATVLFGYLVTLGVTYGIFRLIYPGSFPGLDWKVPVFLFTLLVAVGADYNILLVTRVEEEQKRRGAVAGVTAALTKTGGVISSCGLVMAGTFAALAAGGEIWSMRELGFALAFGALLDTFVVRPILVPAYLIWVNRGKPGRWRTWLGAHRREGGGDPPADNRPAASLRR